MCPLNLKAVCYAANLRSIMNKPPCLLSLVALTDQTIVYEKKMMRYVSLNSILLNLTMCLPPKPNYPFFLQLNAPLPQMDTNIQTIPIAINIWESK